MGIIEYDLASGESFARDSCIYFQKKDFAWFMYKRLLYLRYQRKETKPMTLSKKLTLSLASMAVLGLLAACSNQKALLVPNKVQVRFHLHKVLKLLNRLTG